MTYVVIWLMFVVALAAWLVWLGLKIDPNDRPDIRSEDENLRLGA